MVKGEFETQALRDLQVPPRPIHFQLSENSSVGECSSWSGTSQTPSSFSQNADIALEPVEIAVGRGQTHSEEDTRCAIERLVADLDIQISELEERVAEHKAWIAKQKADLKKWKV